jgi:flagella basal body P-ring formation protein FlgA
LISKLSKTIEWTLIAAAFTTLATVGGTRGAVALANDAVAADAAEPARAAAPASLAERIAQAIAKQYPGARVSVDGKIHWSHGEEASFDSEGQVSLLGDTSRGEMMFAILDSEGRQAADGWVSYQAWQPAYVAVRRVRPNERIAKDQFTLRDVNVASGQAHELRGLMLAPETGLAGLEARQTVLVGQTLLSSYVQRVPDVRRGDAVIVHLVAGALSLSTQGQAEEPAYIGGQIRVSASKTKRELVGKLSEAGIVEVKL